MINFVTKFDGTTEEFDADKLNKWAEFASKYEVDWSAIVLEAYRKCTDYCSTVDLHQAMIDACVEKETTNHLKMAGRLLIGVIYKEAYGGFTKIPHFKSFYKDMIEKSLWAEMDYSPDEIDKLNDVIDHSKDLAYNYTTLRQMKDKYLINDRVNRQVLESPQFMFMGMAMQNMERQPKERRIDDIIKLYTYLSDLKINAPTPFLVNMRTHLKGYASCCVIKSDDTIDGLSTADHIAYTMTAKSAGIGINIDTRSKGDPVRNGQIVHQGKLPYYRANQALVHANMQSSRGGASTVSFTCLDPEIEDLLILKNPTTVAQKRIRDIDYSMLVNRLFVQKVAKNEDWMLVSTLYAPKLFELFYSDNYDGFAEEYDRVLKNPTIKKTIVKARDIANKALKESVETGRIYITYIDTMNHQTPFKDTIYSSNLCQEIALPTKPFKGMQDLYLHDEPMGEIGLCSLASIVLGRVTLDEYEDVAYYTVLMVDNVIDIMEYPFPSLEYTAKARRSLGIGMTNLAYALASVDESYSTLEGKSLIHYFAERHAFYLYKASLRLGIEKSNAPWMDRTKIPNGWLPFDDYNENVDSVVKHELMFNWEDLRTSIINNGGIRNSTLIAYMPVESSSQLTNTTNGLYPVRNLKVVKTSNTNKNLLIVPECETLDDRYDIAWHLDSTDLIDMYAIVQKFTDQAISADLYIDLKESDSVSTSKLLKDFIYMMKMGCKTRYYINSASGIVHDSFKKTKTEVENGCTACKL